MSCFGRSLGSVFLLIALLMTDATAGGADWKAMREAMVQSQIRAPDKIPAALVEQLREGGRMVIPVGQEGGVQELVLLEKREGQIHQTHLLPVRFVPMTGGE